MNPALEEISPPDARAQLKAGSALALDVRESHEFRTGRIVTSKNVPAGNLHAAARGLPLETKTERRSRRR